VRTITIESQGLVSWSHFIALTHITNAGERADHLKAVIEKALSVADLESRIGRGRDPAEKEKRGAPAAQPAEDDVPQPQQPQRFVTAISRVVADVEHLSQREALHDKFVFENLNTVTMSDLGPSGLEDLERLAKALGEAEALAHRLAEGVVAALARLRADMPLAVAETAAAAQ
jgi:hypothetical protein